MNQVTKTDPPHARPRPLAVRMVEAVLFNVKWVLLLFYFGLVVVLLVYAWSFLREIWHLLWTGGALTPSDLSIVALEMGDFVMMGNLIKMILTGSYNSFITKEHGKPNENTTSGRLKEKISTSVVIVATIGLLPLFVNFKATDWAVVGGKLAIYGAFLVGSMVLAVIEYLHIKGEKLEVSHEGH